MTTSLFAKREDLADEGGGRLRIEAAQGSVLCGGKRKMEIKEWNEQKMPKVLPG